MNILNVFFSFFCMCSFYKNKGDGDSLTGITKLIKLRDK